MAVNMSVQDGSALKPAFSYALKVTLTHASELSKGDYLGTYDPYVKLAIDNNQQQQVRSSGRTSTLDPVWKPAEEFDFKLADPTSQTLLVQLWNRVFVLPDRLIGSVSIPLMAFNAQENNTPVRGYELRSESGRGAGSVFFQISVKPLDEILLELWENEWYSLGTGWTSDAFGVLNRRLHWSNEDGSLSHKDFAQVAPKPPLHFSCRGWNFAATKDDINGWLYATTFAGPWCRESSALTVVRRRKWTSICRADSTDKKSVAF